jgi:hypothetical protein
MLIHPAFQPFTVLQNKHWNPPIATSRNLLAPFTNFLLRLHAQPKRGPNERRLTAKRPIIRSAAAGALDASAGAVTLMLFQWRSPMDPRAPKVELRA